MYFRILYFSDSVNAIALPNTDRCLFPLILSLVLEKVNSLIISSVSFVVTCYISVVTAVGSIQVMSFLLFGKALRFLICNVNLYGL